MNAHETTYADWFRRAAAFCVDMIIIAGCAWLVSLLPFGLLQRLGPWGPVVGTVVVLFYFGLGNSVVWGGQTVGKRFCLIRVVDQDGELLSPVRSVGRAAIFWVPFQFNGFPVEGIPEYMTTIWGGLFAASALATVLLFFFNGPSRRCPHDYFTRSATVMSVGTPAFGPDVPRRVVWISAGVGLLALFTTVWSFLHPAAESKDLGPLYRGYRAGLATEGVWGLGVHLNTTTRTVNGQEQTVKTLRISARVTKPKKEFKELRKQLAETVLSAMPEVDPGLLVQVTLETGVHLGFFNTTNRDSKTLPLGQWLDGVK